MTVRLDFVGDIYFDMSRMEKVNVPVVWIVCKQMGEQLHT
jgi:hypothetical protein